MQLANQCCNIAECTLVIVEDYKQNKSQFLTSMWMFQRQQFELQLKHTCRVTFSSAVVGWTPLSQPVEHASHLFVGGHVVGIRVSV